MSALAGRLSELKPAKGGTPCQTCEFLVTLDDEDREALRGKLGATTGARVGARILAEFLSGIEGAPTGSSIEAHRRNGHV